MEFYKVRNLITNPFIYIVFNFKFHSSVSFDPFNSVFITRHRGYCNPCFEKSFWETKVFKQGIISVTALTVWKSKRFMYPIGCSLFQERSSIRSTRSKSTKDIRPPVPGYPTLATNIMARLCNSVLTWHWKGKLF